MPRTMIIIIDDGSEDTALPVTSTITRVGSSPGTGTVTVTRTVPNIEGPVPPPPAPPYNSQTAWETGGVNGSAAPGSILPSGLVAVYAVIGLASFIVCCVAVCTIRGRQSRRSSEDAAAAGANMARATRRHNPNVISPELLARFDLRIFDSSDKFWGDPSILYYSRKDYKLSIEGKEDKETGDAAARGTPATLTDIPAGIELPPITIPARSYSLGRQQIGAPHSPRDIVQSQIKRNASAMDRLWGVLNRVSPGATMASPAVLAEAGINGTTSDYFSLPRAATAPLHSPLRHFRVTDLSPRASPEFVRLADLTQEGKADTETEEEKAHATAETDLDMCAICVDDFEDGDEVRILPCGHRFHQGCIDPWLESSSVTCPLCKSDLRELYAALHKEEEVCAPAAHEDQVQPAPAPTTHRSTFTDYVRKIRRIRPLRRTRRTGAAEPRRSRSARNGQTDGPRLESLAGSGGPGGVAI